MRLRTHILTGTAAALALAPWWRWCSIPFWIGASLADADLYAYYVARHRRLSPRRAFRYYGTLAGRRERATKVLHHPLVPLVALAAMRRAPAVAALGAGIGLHLVLDRHHKNRFRRLRHMLELRSQGCCENCGRPQESVALMEDHYIGEGNRRADRDPAHWTLLCRPCNEAVTEGRFSARDNGKGCSPWLPNLPIQDRRVHRLELHRAG